MKLVKNNIMIIVLVLSVAIFMITAIADTLIGSGYDSLKNSIKKTAFDMESGLDSFTCETIYTIKDNGNKLEEKSEVFKVDNINKKNEKTSTAMKNEEVTTNYSYGDEFTIISKDIKQDKYFVKKLNGWQEYNNNINANPFREEHFSDVEKIFDAVVGGLKDNVQVEEISTGGKVYSGSIMQTQVPTLINAIASFGFKQGWGDSSDTYGMTQIKNDIYIKSISGRAVEDSLGRVNSLVGELIFSCNDEDDILHDITIEVQFNLKDINNTNVQMPNVEGKIIEKEDVYVNIIGAQCVGNYKNNIVIEKNGKFIKIGERILTITHIDNQTISGNYTEIYQDGYGPKKKNKLNYSFETSSYGPQTDVCCTNAEGDNMFGTISEASLGRINFNLSGMNQIFDNVFYRVFEN